MIQITTLFGHLAYGSGEIGDHMSYKTIMSQVEPGDGGELALRTAIDVGHIFGSHLIGVGAQSVPMIASPYGYADGAVFRQLTETVDRQLAACKARFTELTSGLSGRSTWIQGEEGPLVLLSRHAAAADLVVATRPDATPFPFLAATLQDLVMEIGLPVLVPANQGAALNLDTVVVAWKDEREARRAVWDAMPFLKQAKRVALIEVRPARDGPSSSLVEVAQRLERHGVATVTRTFEQDQRRSIAQQLDEHAQALGAKLLVVGAYGHSRLREWALGGVTENLIDDAACHILFCR